jgi:hypothetical protein
MPSARRRELAGGNDEDEDDKEELLAEVSELHNLTEELTRDREELRPELWADPKIAPHLRRAILYRCCNLDGENFLWVVLEEDRDSRAAAFAAETEWIELVVQ